MKIAVCVKQVPTLSAMRFDYKNKTVLRKDVQLEVNPFDVIALGKALDLKKEFGAEITAITMGTPDATGVLTFCFAIGIDYGILISDRAFAGSDTLATARALALVLRDREFDLILCGRNSSDAETGQVGPELAELMDIPHVSNVRVLRFTPHKDRLIAERTTDFGYEVVESTLPALITVVEGLSEERYPRRKEIEASSNRCYEIVDKHKLKGNLESLGSAGSPTSVGEIRIIQTQRLGVVIEEPDPEKLGQMIAANLRDRKDRPTNKSYENWARFERQPGREFWVLVEGVGGIITQASMEILGEVRKLATQIGGYVSALMLKSPIGDETSTVIAYGADEVLYFDTNDVFPAGPVMTRALSSAIQERQPYALIASAVTDARDLLARSAARLGLGMTGDCVGLEIDEQGRLVQLKAGFGGNVVCPILSTTTPYLATLRPGMFSHINPKPVDVIKEEKLRHLENDSRIKLIEKFYQDDVHGRKLLEADIVIGVGKGLGGPENLPVIFSAANKLGAVVAGTRNVTDAGWLPKQVQIGITGKAISPRVYLAIGIRGAFNHMVGLQNVGTLLAINKNRRHPIFSSVDVGVVGDWETYLDPMVDAISKIE